MFFIREPHEFSRIGSGFAGEFHCRFYSCLFANSWFKCAALGKSGEPRRTSAFPGKERKSRQSHTPATAMGCSKFLSSNGRDSIRYFLKSACIRKNTLYCLNSNE